MLLHILNHPRTTAGHGPSVWRLAGRSVGHYAQLVGRNRLHLRGGRLGMVYPAEDGGRYTVFRESRADVEITEPTVLVVGFRLKLLRTSPLLHWAFQRVCLLTTPFWSGFDGFGTKLWLVDRASKNYLGIYEWSGPDRAKNYFEALNRVLTPLSVGGSVWGWVYRHTSLDDYLAARSQTSDGRRVLI